MKIELKYNQFQAFKEKVEKANELVKKLDLNSIEYTVEETERLIGQDWFWGGGYKAKFFNVTITKNIDVTFSKYEFISYLEKEDGVMFSKTIPTKSIPTHFITDESYHGNCDHCKQKRKRKSTYIIFDKEDEKYIQVGSTCINEFLVKDVEKILREVFTVLHSMSDAGEEGIYREARSSKEEDTLPMINFLGMISSISKYGENFISASTAKTKEISSTVDIFCQVLSYYKDRNKKHTEKSRYSYFSQNTPYYTEEQKEKIEKMYASIIPTPEHYKYVDDIILWVESLKNSTSEYEINLHNYFKIYKESGVPASKLSWVGSAIGAYYRNNKIEQERKTTSDNSASNHIGNVGERLTFKGRVKSIRFIHQNIQYFNIATSYLFTFEDMDGNIFTNFTTTKIENIAEGDICEIKGTVKKHSDYKGVKQTNLNRIKIKKID